MSRNVPGLINSIAGSIFNDIFDPKVQEILVNEDGSDIMCVVADPEFHDYGFPAYYVTIPIIEYVKSNQRIDLR